jgi:hypothetical protein
MRLPFGLDFKTAIVTTIFILFVLPWLMSFVGGLRKGNAKAE